MVDGSPPTSPSKIPAGTASDLDSRNPTCRLPPHPHPPGGFADLLSEVPGEVGGLRHGLRRDGPVLEFLPYAAVLGDEVDAEPQ